MKKKGHIKFNEFKVAEKVEIKEPILKPKKNSSFSDLRDDISDMIENISFHLGDNLEPTEELVEENISAQPEIVEESHSEEYESISNEHKRMGSYLKTIREDVAFKRDRSDEVSPPERDVNEYLETLSQLSEINEQQTDYLEQNKNFVTFDDMKTHYKTFASRVQTQLSSLGGGGAANIDDQMDFDPTGKENGYVVTWNDAQKKYTLQPGGASGLDTTDELAEGLVNLYYTQTRVEEDIFAMVDSDYVTNRVTIPTTIDYKGTIDVTTATAPSALNGDMYINTVTGVAGATWIGIAGETIPENTYMIYDSTGNEWQQGGGTIDYAGVDSAKVIGIIDGRIDSDNFMPIGATTTQVAEGTNLYYTKARLDADLLLSNTDQLNEGILNYYYTTARWDSDFAVGKVGNFDSDFNLATTTDLSEGTNLYFTDDRWNTSYATTGAETDITVLQNQVIELEQEIDAIAPSLLRGRWIWSDSAVGVGKFQTLTSGDTLASLYSDTAKMVFNNVDHDGVSNDFDASDVGNYLEMFDRLDSDYFLGVVTAVAVSGNTTTIDLTKTSSLGAPAISESARMKLFGLSDGGEDVTNFLRKTGDTMTGTLQLKGSETSTVLRARLGSSDTITLSTLGKLTFTGVATASGINKTGGDFGIALNNDDFISLSTPYSGTVALNRPLTMARGANDGNNNRIELKGIAGAGDQLPFKIQSQQPTGGFTTNGYGGIDIDMSQGSTSRNRFSVTGSNGIGFSVDGLGNPKCYKQLSMTSKKIIALATPTAGTDAANKDYVDENSGGVYLYNSNNPPASAPGGRGTLLLTTSNNLYLYV